jgi:hypothetical protein
VAFRWLFPWVMPTTGAPRIASTKTGLCPALAIGWIDGPRTGRAWKATRRRGAGDPPGANVAVCGWQRSLGVQARLAEVGARSSHEALEAAVSTDPTIWPRTIPLYPTQSKWMSLALATSLDALPTSPGDARIPASGGQSASRRCRRGGPAGSGSSLHSASAHGGRGDRRRRHGSNYRSQLDETFSFRRTQPMPKSKMFLSPG